MGAASLAAPQTLNMYSYCGNDPVNNTDPNGLFWGFLKKLFKWVMLVIAIVAMAMTIVGAILGPVAFATFTQTLLGGILNFIAQIPGMVSSALFGNFAGSIAGAMGPMTDLAFATTTKMIEAAVGWTVLASVGAAVGAVVNNFASSRKSDKSFYSSKYAKRLAKCIWFVFDKDANLLEEQTSKNAPSILVDPSLKDAGIAGQSRPGDDSVGKFGQIRMSDEFPTMSATDAKTGKPFEVSGTDFKMRTYVHELGNKLNRDVIAKGGSSHGAQTVSKSGIEDKDAGARLESCVFGDIRP